MRLIGLALANALTAFSGGLVAQFQGFADVGMGARDDRGRAGGRHHRRDASSGRAASA